MKHTFPEYYPIDKESINRIWDNGTLCYDANVLLNFYRYSKNTRDKIFENMEYFIDRTILPHQVGFEYHKNKRAVETNLENSYDNIINVLNKKVNELESGDLSTYRKHCAIDIDRDILKPIKTTVAKITDKLNDLKSNHSANLNATEIHTKITALFDGKVSERFSDNDLEKIYNDGKKRYEKKIPPGFADYAAKKDKDDNSLYGDLIVWRHLMAISKDKDCDIIFVTDDRKKDWWNIEHGQTKGPLPALYREFRKETNHMILIYSVEDFMKYAPEHTDIAVSKKVINEIKELRKVDQRRKLSELYISGMNDLKKYKYSYDQNPYTEHFAHLDEIAKAYNTAAILSDSFKGLHVDPISPELRKIMEKYSRPLNPDTTPDNQ